MDLTVLAFASMQNINNMIEIRQVLSKKEQKDFLNFPNKLYKKCPFYVPPLYMDEKKIFRDDYVYNDQCETIYYNAYIDGKIVGRISGIIQHVSNAKENTKRVRFTRFDAINNQEVANALFSTAENWAKKHGMDTIVGPLGFSDLEREGLLIDGFDQLSTYEEQYNYDYYQILIENYGFKKEVDWVERKLYAPDVYDDRIEKISQKMFEKYHLKFGEAKNTKDFINKYADKFFDIIDKTYVNIYGSVPFTEEMMKMMIDNFKLIINIKHVAVVVDENDNVVCFGICFPSLAKALVGSGGHLRPLTLLKVLKAIKKPNVLDLGLIGVLPEYESKGIASAIIAKVMQYLNSGTIKYIETNLNLEDNHRIINQWKHFNNVLHKRRRCFVKKID